MHLIHCAVNHFVVTNAVRIKNYVGGPALRCGGDATRARFGRDCPMGEEAEIQLEEELELIKGISWEHAAAAASSALASLPEATKDQERANERKAESRHRWHLPYDVSTSGPHSSPQTMQ